MRSKVISLCLLAALLCLAAPSASAQWTDLGNGLAGASGTPPVLLTVGGLFPAAPTMVTLSGGQPGTTSYLVVGVSNISAPLKGGILVPFPNVLLPLSLDHQGTFMLNFAWPNGVPTGSQFFWQAWMPDAGAPHGFAASNACASVAH